jgi:excisionase family DNA binding protein
MTAKEAACYLKISENQLYELKLRNKIPYALVGKKKLRFLKSQLDKWLEGGGAGGDMTVASVPPGSTA